MDGENINQEYKKIDHIASIVRRRGRNRERERERERERDSMREQMAFRMRNIERPKTSQNAQLF